jgi:hypothetical protein
MMISESEARCSALYVGGETASETAARARTTAVITAAAKMCRDDIVLFEVAWVGNEGRSVEEATGARGRGGASLLEECNEFWGEPPFGKCNGWRGSGKGPESSFCVPWTTTGTTELRVGTLNQRRNGRNTLGQTKQQRKRIALFDCNQ